MTNETKTILNPQPTEDNPVVVDNYPYGFKRTEIRYWVESVKKKGDRFVSQTLNPKTQVWNKPKKSTYNAVNIVYRDESNQHIEYFALWRSTDADAYKRFMERIGGTELNELQKEELKILRAYIKTYEDVEFSCRTAKFKNKTTGEIRDTVPIFEMENYKKEEERKQQEIKNSIGKSVAYNYHHDVTA